MPDYRDKSIVRLIAALDTCAALRSQIDGAAQLVGMSTKIPEAWKPDVEEALRPCGPSIHELERAIREALRSIRSSSLP